MRLYLAILLVFVCGAGLRWLLLRVGAPVWVAWTMSALGVLIALGWFASGLIKALSNP